ncbi:MAG: hypothetical protein QE487_07655 [Fluviicola sp.]|nr:hypothetical protein [Fluviicola sp.]
MKTLLEKVGLTVSISIVFLVLFGLFIALLPLFIPLFIISTINSKIEYKNYKRYLITLEGTNFFCYNNRKGNEEFFKSTLQPHLPKDVKIVFLNGRSVESDYTKKYISMALYNVKPKTGFPYLMKVSDGEIKSLSLNQSFYNVKNNGKDVSPFIQQVESFFENSATPNQ